MPEDSNELNRSLGRIEGQLGEVLARLDADRILAADTSRRVTSLERWRWFLSGAWAVVSVVVAFLIKAVMP